MEIRFQLNEEDVLSFFRQQGVAKERTPFRLKMIKKNVLWAAGGGLVFILIGAWFYGGMILILAGLAYRFRHLLIEGNDEMVMEAKVRAMDPMLKGITTITLDEYRIHHKSKYHDNRWDLRDIEQITVYPDCMSIAHQSKGSILVPTSRLRIEATTDFIHLLQKNVKAQVFVDESPNA